jgi:phage-related protein
VTVGEFKLAGAYVEARMDRTKLDADIARLKSQTVSIKVKADLDVGVANTRIAALVKARRMKVGVDLDTKAASAALLKLGKSRAIKLTVGLDDKAAAAALLRLTKDRKVKILAALDATSALARLIELTKARTVKVRVDLNQTALASLTDSTRTVDILTQINDPAYQRAQKKLDKLTADRSIIIRPSVDTRVAADELRNLTRRQRVRIGVDVDTRVAADDIANLTRRRTMTVTANANTAAARLRLDALARDRRTNIDVNVRSGGLSSLSSLGSSSGPIGSLVGSLMNLKAAASSALPMLASLGQSLVQMGPLAAVAVPAALSLGAAFAAIKIGTSGVGDAIKAVASGSDAAAAAMAKLAPNAREFVTELVAQKTAWTGLKLDVQNQLFAGLGNSFTTMAKSALPALRTGLVGMAGVLNTMAKNAMSAVTNLAKAGTLKSMFAGLTSGLAPLARIPGQFITALAQLSVAASPAFQRITAAAGSMADGIMAKLNAAFKSGGLTDAINSALDIARQFGHLLGDIAGTVGNVLKAAAAGGGDALGTLGAVFSELRKVTGMPEVQKALASIFSAINSIAKLLAGTLGAAVQALLPVFAALAPVVTQVVGILSPVLASLAKTLGAALMPIATALGPVLVAAAQAIGSLVSAAAPLLPVIGQMIAALGPVLTPVLGVISMLFGALAPVLAQLGKSLLPPFLKITTTLAGVFKDLSPVLGAALEQLGTNGLVPIVAALGTVIGDLVSAYADQFVSMFTMLLPVIPMLIPVVVQLAQSISEILLAVAPLLPQLMLLAAQLITQVLPAIIPLVPVIADLVSAFLWLATGVITKIVIPILGGLIGFMSGLYDKMRPGIAAVEAVTKAIAAAFQWLSDILIGHSIIPDMVKGIISWFTMLWTSAKGIFTGLARDVANIWSGLWAKVRSAWTSFWSGLSAAMNSARSWMGNAFSGLRTTISSTWSGLWNGVSSKFTTVISGVRTAISSFATGTKATFTNLRDSLGTIWNGIKEKFAAPVRFTVGTVYNDGIRKMWDTIASKVGLPQLPTIKLGFAKGGPVPGVGTGDIVPAMLTPGERVLSVPQVAHLGGHRGIDAMLGKDHPTGTGGNPTTTQDRKMQQPVPKFGLGGIVSDITGAVSGAVSGSVDWAKDLVVGGLQAAARKAISTLVQPLINRIPGGGTGDLMKGLSGKALDGVLGKLGKEDDKAVGGPAVQKALSWAKSQAGLPYQWAGNGNPSWDCSGLMSAIESVIRGEAPHRRWATGSFSGSTAPDGWVRNLTSPFMIGVTNAGVGHTAGTLAGVNVESQGTLGVLAGSKARGANDSLFQNRYGFKPATKFDSGGLLQPGATMAVNRTGRPERILDPHHTAALDAMLAGGGAGGVTIQAINISGTFDFATPAARKAAANELAAEMNEALRLYNRSRT